MNVLTVLLIFVLIGVMVERMLYDKYVRAMRQAMTIAQQTLRDTRCHLVQQGELIRALINAAIQAQFGLPTEITVLGSVWRFEKAQLGSGLGVIVKVDPPIVFATNEAADPMLHAKQVAQASLGVEEE